MKAALKNLERLTVRYEDGQEVFFGCNQAWYEDEWQRRAGCGPSVASHLFAYSLGLAPRTTDRRGWLRLMEDVWHYVTPTDRGMPTTELFCQTTRSYAQARGATIAQRVCDVPAEALLRPTLAEIVTFLTEALQNDAPVAFLNLCNGEETCLYRWHWVTIVALDYDPDGRRAVATIFDEGRQLDIDLALWHSTTTLGGGFVWFVPAD